MKLTLAKTKVAPLIFPKEIGSKTDRIEQLDANLQFFSVWEEQFGFTM